MQADAYFDTQEEALREVQERRAELHGDNVLVRCEKSGYDNWRVYSFPADVMVDSFVDGFWPGNMHLDPLSKNQKWSE